MDDEEPWKTIRLCMKLSLCMDLTKFHLISLLDTSEEVGRHLGL